MERGKRNYKVTVTFTDDTEEDLFYFADTFDQAAFLAGVTMGARGETDRVCHVVTKQIIEDAHVGY